MTLYSTSKPTVRALKQGAIQLVLAYSLAIGVNAHAMTEMFLEVSDIAGDSQDSIHAGEIDVLSAVTNFNRNGCGAVVIQKYVDRASAPIINGVVTQKYFPEMTLSYRTPGSGRLDSLQLKMNDARFVRSTSDNNSGIDLLMETVRIRAESIDVVYTPIRGDGTAEAPVVTTVMCNGK